MMRKRHGILQPIPVSEIEIADTVHDKVDNFLKQHTNKAYSIQRLMIEVFEKEEDDILGSFVDWTEKSDIVLYNRIKRVLEELDEQGKISKKKYERAIVYWWKK